MSESVVLCEGYHDRAFWAGWLGHLNCAPCRDERKKPKGGSAAQGSPSDHAPKGEYKFQTPASSFIKVTPCGGRDNVLQAARIRLIERETKPLACLVVNVDADIPAAMADSAATGMTLAHLEEWCRKIDPSAKLNDQSEVELDDGVTKVCLIRWETSDEPGEGLPQKQTLERLVCAALVAAYPARAPAVRAWLDARPKPPPVDPKDHAWSYMAGWYAKGGCAEFFRALWDDPAIVAELESRLRKSGAWQIAAALAS